MMCAADSPDFVSSFTAMDITNMPHDDIYILDSSLVVALVKNENEHWTRWVQEHLRLGRTCYITPTVVNECHDDALPPSVVPLMIPPSASELPNTASIVNAYEGNHFSFLFSSLILLHIDISHRLILSEQTMRSDLAIVMEAGVLSTACPHIFLPLLLHFSFN